MATSLFLFLNHTCYDFELQLEFGTDEESSWVLVALISAATTVCLLGLTAGAGAATQGSGCGTQDRHCAAIWEEPTDHLKLQATPGDRLTLSNRRR